MDLEFQTLGSVLQNNLKGKERDFVNWLLFGPNCPTEVSSESRDNFDIRRFSFLFGNTSSVVRPVTIAVFQNAIVENTNVPIGQQKSALLELGTKAIKAAAKDGVKIFCFQEYMPMAFCTQKKLPWVEFAEDAFTGITTTHLSELAKDNDMVIISPILERDAFTDALWNSAVIIGNDGNVLGITRKNHVPISGRFSEAYYYNPSNLGHPVFQTAFGRIAVAICYERHHPQCFIAYGINSAEIIFNPSATVKSFSESLWPIEARSAATSTGTYVCAINRIGTETIDDMTVGPFFGSSYVTAPDGSRTPDMSTDRNGLLIVDIDLNQCSNDCMKSTKMLSLFAQTVSSSIK